MSNMSIELAATHYFSHVVEATVQLRPWYEVGKSQHCDVRTLQQFYLRPDTHVTLLT